MLRTSSNRIIARPVSSMCHLSCRPRSLNKLNIPTIGHLHTESTTPIRIEHSTALLEAAKENDEMQGDRNQDALGRTEVVGGKGSEGIHFMR
jgi:hypothetical protein